MIPPQPFVNKAQVLAATPGTQLLALFAFLFCHPLAFGFFICRAERSDPSSGVERPLPRGDPHIRGIAKNVIYPTKVVTQRVSWSLEAV